jgi:hypothetical protein
MYGFAVPKRKTISCKVSYSLGHSYVNLNYNLMTYHDFIRFKKYGSSCTAQPNPG